MGERVLIDWCWSWMTKGLEGVVRQLEALADSSQHPPKPDQVEDLEKHLATLARVRG